MPEQIPTWLVVTVASVLFGLTAFLLKRLLSKYDDEISSSKTERREIKADQLAMRADHSESEREVHKRIDGIERHAEREYVKREDLQKMLEPTNLLLSEIRKDQKGASVLPQILKQQGEQVQDALHEIKELREENNEFWKQFGGALRWAKRKSEE